MDAATHLPEDDAVKEIKTFVFFDLETSGFSSKARILELSLIAVSRSDLITMFSKQVAHLSGQEISILRSPSKYGPPELPRVVHKYTRLFYPKTLILPVVEEVTGLNNYNLEHLSPFSSSDADSIKNFLNLPSPVALLAHNGNAFDFPILKAELLNINEDILNDIFCVDTLLCARELETNAYKAEIETSTKVAEEFSDSDFDDVDLSQVSKKNCISLPNTSISSSQTFKSYHTPQKSSQTISKNVESESTKSFTVSENAELKDISELALDFSDEDSNDFSSNKVVNIEANPSMVDSNNSHRDFGQAIYVTPDKIQNGIIEAKTPKKLDTIQNNGVYTPEQNSQRNPTCSSAKVNGGTLPKKTCVKRSLTYGSPVKSKTPFSQPVLYQRLFGATYKAHSAEKDAVALLQICSFYGNEFLKWADKNLKMFKDIPPRWVSSKNTKEIRKTFEL